MLFSLAQIDMTVFLCFLEWLDFHLITFSNKIYAFAGYLNVISN